MYAFNLSDLEASMFYVVPGQPGIQRGPGFKKKKKYDNFMLIKGDDIPPPIQYSFFI